jgi:hypothetical protein
MCRMFVVGICVVMCVSHWFPALRCVMWSRRLHANLIACNSAHLCDGCVALNVVAICSP